MNSVTIDPISSGTVRLNIKLCERGLVIRNYYGISPAQCSTVLAIIYNVYSGRNDIQ